MKLPTVLRRCTTHPHFQAFAHRRPNTWSTPTHPSKSSSGTDSSGVPPQPFSSRLLKATVSLVFVSDPTSPTNGGSCVSMSSTGPGTKQAPVDDCLLNKRTTGVRSGLESSITCGWARVDERGSHIGMGASWMRPSSILPSSTLTLDPHTPSAPILQMRTLRNHWPLLFISLADEGREAKPQGQCGAGGLS